MGLEGCIYYMSLQYRNKSKSLLTSPTPAQLPAVALSTGHIVYGAVSDTLFQPWPDMLKSFCIKTLPTRVASCG
jgi:hypothetical protein